MNITPNYAKLRNHNNRNVKCYKNIVWKDTLSDQNIQIEQTRIF